MQAAIKNISAFGKVPTHGDFVRQNASGRAIRAFEDWLQRGLFYMKGLREAEVESAYDESPPVGFLFENGQEHAPLTGIMQASRDAAGRKYPFVIAAELAAVTPMTNVSSLIASLGTLYEAAADTAAAGAAGEISHREITKWAADDLRPIVDAENGRVPENHVRYMSQTTLGRLGEALWTHFEASGKYFLFKNLLEVVESLPEDATTSAGYGLRFPVHDGVPTSSTAFWLSVCEQLLPVPLSNATLFWTMAPRAEHSMWTGTSSLLVFFAAPAPRILADVFSGSVRSDMIFDLQDGGGALGAEAALDIPPRLGRLLEEESNSLSDFVLMLGARGSDFDRSVPPAP